jgi:ketosteroid isomerase-like protein
MKRSAYLIAAAAVFAPSCVGAQAPGYQRIDIGAIRAEYNAEVLDRIADVLLEWSTAWSTDDIDALAESYWPDAVLIPHDRTPIRGRTAIREYFAEVAGDYGDVEAFMLDFDASGGMAQVFGNYMIEVRAGEQAGKTLTGPVVTIYLMRGRTWAIRTQVFLPSGG